VYVGGTFHDEFSSNAPDLFISFLWDGERRSVSANHENRHGWILGKLGYITPGMRWRAVIWDRDAFSSDDLLASSYGVMTSNTLAWTRGSVEFTCRFLTQTDYVALLRQFSQTVATNVATLVRRPQHKGYPIFRQIFEDLHRLTELSSDDNKIVVETREMVRAGLLDWIPRATKAPIDDTGATLSMGPGLSVILENPATANESIVFSPEMQPYGLQMYGTWIDDDGPRLAYGRAIADLNRTVWVHPGGQVVIPFRTNEYPFEMTGSPSPRQRVLIGAWKKGPRGAPNVFMLRR